MEKSVNINEAVQRIKKAGESNVRAVPMAGGVHSGLYSIEVHDGGGWVAITEGITLITANNIIRQATDRLICG